MLTDGTSTYAYNHANRLISIINQQSTINYSYNGDGDRLSESVNGMAVVFVNDLNTGLTQVLSDGTNNYLYGLGRISQSSISNQQSEFFLGDALGSVRQLTDANGKVTLAKWYEPYGDVLVSVGDSKSDYGYTGEMQDRYIKLLFLRARYYNPANGQFTSHDSWSGDSNRPQTFNGWGYVEGNPIYRTDPTGNSVCYEPLPESCRNGLDYLNSSAVSIRSQVRSGAMEPVEGFARLADDGKTQFNDIRDLVWAMTIVLDDMDKNRGQIWLQAIEPDTGLGSAKSQKWIGQDWLPYKNNLTYGTPNIKYPDWCDPKNPKDPKTCDYGGRWIHSLRGDWNTKYWDKTANQAYHFWFYTAVTLFDGKGFAMAANFEHDNPLGLFGYKITDYDFIGSAEDEPPPPWMVPSWPDWDLAGQGIDLGSKLVTDSSMQQLGCLPGIIQYQYTDIGSWIRVNLKG
jgi:RHS repeat-associated protein